MEDASTICIEAKRRKLSFVDEIIFFAGCSDTLLDRFTFGFTGESIDDDESVEDVPTFCTPPSCIVVREAVSSSSSSSQLEAAIPAPNVHDVNMERNVCSRDAGTEEESLAFLLSAILFESNDALEDDVIAEGVLPLVMAVSKLRRISRADCCNRAMVNG